MSSDHDRLDVESMLHKILAHIDDQFSASKGTLFEVNFEFVFRLQLEAFHECFVQHARLWTMHEHWEETTFNNAS